MYASHVADSPEGYYESPVPQNELELARLKLSIGAMALEYADVKGADELAARRFAKKLTSSDPDALLGFKTVLSLLLYAPHELRRTSPEEVTVTNVVPDEESVQEVKAPVHKIWRAKPILETSSPKMSAWQTLEFYFPGDMTTKLEGISKLALDLEHDLKNSPATLPNNLSRAVCVLIHARNSFSEMGVEVNPHLIELVNRSINSYISKTEPYVERIVKRYAESRHSFSLGDLVIEGQLGLLKGLERFDLNTPIRSNVLLWSFTYIRGQVVDELRKTGSIIPPSRNDIKLANKLKEKDFETKLSDEEIQEARLAQERLRIASVQSLDAPISENAETTYHDIVAETLIDDTEDEEQALAGDVDMQALLSALNARDQTMIKMRFGFPPYEREHTLREIGEEIHLTESRISQLLPKALELMKLLMNRRLPKAPSETESTEASEGLNSLSERQIQVLELASLGLRNETIANRLGTSEETIKTHIVHILDRLEADNRSHAVAQGFREGLLTRTVTTINPESLTGRRLQVLQMIADGKDNAEIGAALFIGEETVKTYVRQILQALNVKSRTHAVRLGFEADLLK